MSNLTLGAILSYDVSAVSMMAAKYQSYDPGLSTFSLRSAGPLHGAALWWAVTNVSQVNRGVRLSQARKVRGFMNTAVYNL